VKLKSIAVKPIKNFQFLLEGAKKNSHKEAQVTEAVKAPKKLSEKFIL
jgi:hypothetical protein